MKNKKNLLSELYKMKLFGYNYTEKSKNQKNDNIILPNDINELNTRINYCSLCELSKISKSKVSHLNNLENKIVILVPFVLNKSNYNILNNITKKYLNINIENILILNLIKCNNNEININEKCFDICKDYTIKQLEILNPKSILSFGDVYEYIISDKLEIGQKIRYNTSDMYYLNNLEFIARNPSCIEKYENLFNKIKNDMERIWDT